MSAAAPGQGPGPAHPVRVNGVRVNGNGARANGVRVNGNGARANGVRANRTGAGEDGTIQVRGEAR